MLERILAPALGVLLALALLLAGQQWQAAVTARGAEQRAKSDLAAYKLEAESQARVGMAALLADQQRIRLRQQGAFDAEFISRKQAEADARRSADELGRLQRDLGATSIRFTSAGTGPALGGECAPARAAAAMLADMLGQCSERRSELASVADEGYGAGQLCERSYDALKPLIP